MSANPFAPPRSSVDDVDASQREEIPELWNPNVAANWSLLFSPAFGAFIHMKNWQALGEPEKASASKVWVILTLVVIFAVAFLPMLLPATKALDSLPNSFGFVLLFSWYFTSGRAQARYVHEQFGKSYPHKGWAKPLGIAVLAILGFIVAGAILTVIGTRLTGKA